MAPLNPMITRSRFLTGMLSVATLAACGKPPATTNTAAAAVPTDQDALVAAAKKEGRVSLGAGGHTDAQAALLKDEFAKKYGITVEFIRENGGEIAQKLQSQLAAGNVTFDVISHNDTSTLNAFAADQVLADPALSNLAQIIAPLALTDVTYAPFTWAAMGYSYNSSTTSATNLPKTWDELAAAPATKVMGNPASSGAALTFAAVLNQVAPNFYAELAKGGKVLASDSALSLGQTVLTGEASYGLPGIEHDVSTAKAAGEPLAMAYPSGKLGALPSYIVPLSAAAHPNAARLLVQFALSAEFQAAQSAIGSRSVLAEVAVPAGFVEVPDDQIIVVPAADLASEKDARIADFKKAIAA